MLQIIPCVVIGREFTCEVRVCQLFEQFAMHEFANLSLPCEGRLETFTGQLFLKQLYSH